MPDNQDIIVEYGLKEVLTRIESGLNSGLAELRANFASLVARVSILETRDHDAALAQSVRESLVSKRWSKREKIWGIISAVAGLIALAFVEPLMSALISHYIHVHSTVTTK